MTLLYEAPIEHLCAPKYAKENRCFPTDGTVWQCDECGATWTYQEDDIRWKRDGWWRHRRNLKKYAKRESHATE